MVQTCSTNKIEKVDTIRFQLGEFKGDDQLTRSLCRVAVRRGKSRIPVAS